MTNYFDKLINHLDKNPNFRGDKKYKALRSLLFKELFCIISISCLLKHKFNYILIALLVFLMLFEAIRLLTASSEISYYCLLIINIILTSFLISFSNGLLYPFNFMLLAEILFNRAIKTRVMIRLIIIHMISFFTFELLFSYKFYGINDIFSMFITYFSALLIMLLLKAQKKDKRRIYDLNMELKEQNLKLQEYSLKIEELTLEKERTRVAQELHDSLGHYLMAISMHLGFLEKTLDISPEKSKATIDKTKNILDNSIKELRKTVYELKENKVDSSFSDAIDSLIFNFSIGSSIDFKVTTSPLIESLSPLLKDTLYKTIKESLTNGMKHGDAKFFNISVLMLNHKVHLTISNIGYSGSKFIMSNGLKGIEERIHSENGIVNFSYTKSGFKTTALI